MFFQQRQAANAPLSYFFGFAGHAKAVAVEMAPNLHDSVQRLLRLPPELEIYPGHQAGSACGAGISGKPASTLAFERRFNPMLSLPVQDFVDAFVTETPAPPAQMQPIKQHNLGRAQ